MKFTIKSSNPPQIFADYISTNPSETWKAFTDTKDDIVQEIRKRLLEDQRGLCAYCEIDLIISNGKGYSDFRVEHFHPKSDEHPKWTFRWDNLMAVCCGGDRSFICDDGEQRFSSPDLSCDAAKGSQILDDVIFNPTTDNVLLSDVFEYTNSGAMLVSEKCDEKQRAADTISALCLSNSASTRRNPAERLDRLRGAVIQGLMEQVEELGKAGMQIEDIMQDLAASMFSDDPKQTWPKFFSCVRWYLGSAAEDRLDEIGYCG